MTIAPQISKHLHNVYFGNNWTGTYYSEALKDVTWDESITKISDFNTILKLVFHTQYFIKAIKPV